MVFFYLPKNQFNNSRLNLRGETSPKAMFLDDTLGLGRLFVL
jgi:hypothetical protein